jgi:hypothetical protein
VPRSDPTISEPVIVHIVLPLTVVGLRTASRVAWWKSLCPCLAVSGENDSKSRKLWIVRPPERMRIPSRLTIYQSEVHDYGYC